MIEPDDDDDQGEPDGLFEVESIPLPESFGSNADALETALAAGRLSGRLVADDAALIQAARSGARVLDQALRSKQAAYAYQAAMRPYQDVLDRLGLNGRGELPAAGAATGPAAALLAALGQGPTGAVGT